MLNNAYKCCSHLTSSRAAPLHDKYLCGPLGPICTSLALCDPFYMFMKYITE